MTLLTEDDLIRAQRDRDEAELEAIAAMQQREHEALRRIARRLAIALTCVIGTIAAWAVLA
jgi:hypothetical protein